MFLNDLFIFNSSNKSKFVFHFTSQLWSLGNTKPNFENFPKFLVLNSSLWFLKAANDIKGGSPFMFS